MTHVYYGNIDADYHDERDRPFSFHWTTLDKSLLYHLLPLSRDKDHDKVLNSMLTEAVLAYQSGEQWVSYSRRKGFYADRRRYWGTSITYDNVRHCIEEALSLGLIEEQRARPGDHLRTQRQSRFRATPALIGPLMGAELEYRFHEAIRMRDAEGSLVWYPNSDNIRRMRREIKLINEFLRPITVDLTAPGVTRTNRHWIIDRGPEKGLQYILPAPIGLYRVFSRGSWSRGGRLYGWWQSIPKTVRPHTRLDGETVVEPDFSQFHAAILYAKRGIKLKGDPDAYVTGDYPRGHGKIAFNIGINTPTFNKALGAIVKELKVSRAYASKLLNAIKSRHHDVADAFGSDMGMKLMRDDSEITLKVMKDCVRHEIPALPIHDSFLTPARQAGDVMEFMTRAFSSVFPGSTPCIVRL